MILSHTSIVVQIIIVSNIWTFTVNIVFSIIIMVYTYYIIVLTLVARANFICLKGKATPGVAYELMTNYGDPGSPSPGAVLGRSPTRRPPPSVEGDVVLV